MNSEYQTPHPDPHIIRHSKKLQIFKMHVCLYWYWPYIHEKSFQKYLDIHSRGKSDKNGIFDVVTSCSIFDNIFFEEYFLMSCY